MSAASHAGGGAAGYRWFTSIVALFTTSLVVSNIIAVKLIALGELAVPAAVILFPLAYIFGDVLTEVYGFERARQAIWIGFACNLVAVVAIAVAGTLPPASFWTANAFSDAAEADRAFGAILGFAPRLLVASFLAYLCGEFVNSYVLARLKVKTAGRHLWVRTISSTALGQGVDSAVFITVAFWGLVPALGPLIVTQWAVKTVYEIVATPLTYVVIGALKRSEGVDVFDVGTAFSPWRFSPRAE